MIRIKASFSRCGAVYCVRYPIESPEDLVEVLKEGATLAERTRPRSGTRFVVYQHGYGPTETTWAAFEGAKDLLADYLFLTADQWPKPHGNRVTTYRLAGGITGTD